MQGNGSWTAKFSWRNQTRAQAAQLLKIAEEELDNAARQFMSAADAKPKFAAAKTAAGAARVQQLQQPRAGNWSKNKKRCKDNLAAQNPADDDAAMAALLQAVGQAASRRSAGTAESR